MGSCWGGRAALGVVARACVCAVLTLRRVTIRLGARDLFFTVLALTRPLLAIVVISCGHRHNTAINTHSCVHSDLLATTVPLAFTIIYLVIIVRAPPSALAVPSTAVSWQPRFHRYQHISGATAIYIYLCLILPSISTNRTLLSERDLLRGSPPLY